MIEIEAPGGEIVRSAIPHSLSVTDEDRSEEHTSELQSLAYLVCRLLLEKKKKTIKIKKIKINNKEIWAQRI